MTRRLGGSMLGAALLGLLALAPRAISAPRPPGAIPPWVLPRSAAVARTERLLSPPVRGPVAAKLTTWRTLAPAVAGRMMSQSVPLDAAPDRWLWALLVDTGGDSSRAG